MMSLFSCFSAKEAKKVKDDLRKEIAPLATARSEYHAVAYQEKHKVISHPSGANKKEDETMFTFRELAFATSDFHSINLLGEGGFGRVYRGTLPSSEIVAVKQLDVTGFQGSREFLTEVTFLSNLCHPNLVRLIGYCCDGNQKLVVYEYMELGSLDHHLFGPPDQEPLSWYQRMKIAYCAAVGLEYLHEVEKPPIIFRDLKSSNILLDDQYNAKLSDFGLAKVAPEGENAISSRSMGTYGYAAPEHIRDNILNTKIDVYSYGVLMLELITGRRAVDFIRPSEEQELVHWAEPMLKDQQRFKELVDPRLGGKYPEKSLNQAVGIAAMCLQLEPTSRPLMTDVVLTLEYLVNPPKEGAGGSGSQKEKPLEIKEPISDEPIKEITEEGVVEESDAKLKDVKGKGVAVFNP